MNLYNDRNLNAIFAIWEQLISKISPTMVEKIKFPFGHNKFKTLVGK